MKAKLLRLVPAGLMAALIAFPADLRAGDGDNPPLTYVYPDQSVWTTKLDEKGEPDNPLLRIAARMFAEAGIEWRGQSLPAARMFEHLRDGRAQFSMLVNAPALASCCMVSRAAVAGTELRAYRHPESPQLAAKEDMAGRSVIIIHGYSYAGLLDFIKDGRNRVTVHVTETHASAFAMLKHKRADYVLDYIGPAEETLAAHPIAGLVSDPLSRLDVHLVLAKSYPRADELMARLEGIIGRMDVVAAMRGDTKGR